MTGRKDEAIEAASGHPEGADSQYRALFEGIADGVVIHDTDGKILDANQVCCERLGYTLEELQSMHLAGILPPEQHKYIGAHVTDVLSNDTVRFETEYLTRNGVRIACEVLERTVDYRGAKAIQSVARDITVRKRSEAQLRAVRDVSLELVAELDLNSVLCAIASHAIDLVGGTSGGLYLHQPEGDVLERVVSIGSLTMPVGSVLHRGEGLSGRIWQTGKPLVIEDYQSWDGRAVQYDSDCAVTVVGVPVRWGGEFLGILNVSAPSDLPRTFTEADADLLTLFAAQAAVAIRNARLYQQAQHEIEERSRAEAELKESREGERHFQERLRDLIQATQDLSRIESFDDLCRKAVELGRNRLGFDRLGLWFFDEDDSDYIVGAFGTDRDGRTRDERHWRIHRPDCLDGLRRTRGVDVVYREQVIAEEEDGSRTPVDRAVAAISEGSDVTGYLALDNLRRQQPITARDQEMLILYANTLGHLVSRLRSAEALRESEEQFRTLVAQMPDGVSINAGGRIVFANKALCTMLRASSEEQVIGQEAARFVAPRFRGEVRKSVERQRRKQPTPERLEIKLVRLDGSTFDAELVARQMILRGQAVTQVLVRDVTDRKQMAEEHLKVQKLDALGVAAGGIAHDFNNILTGVVGNISLAMALADPNGTVYERLRDADNAAFRAKDLARELLTFARGGTPIRRVCAVGEVVKDAASFSLSDSRSKCELSIPENLWPVEADSGQISQAINAIVTNADHAMPHGGLIKIAAKNCTLEDQDRLPLNDGRYVRITVEDQGHGIPEDHLRNIFDPYFTTKQRGAGLGLARAYSIAAKHDGYIDVSSELGVGTVFYLYLPATQKEIASDRAVPAAAKPGKGRILVMDDEQIVRETVGKMLRHLGYGVDFAKEGTEAVALYDQAAEAGEPFDAVIMDLTILGGTGGKEAIQELLHIDPDASAIVSSGYSTDPIMTDFEDYGFKAAVAKPFEMAELSRVLTELGLEH